MLQRAASNAYSWWWASHIRTKQSKWMEQNLQDMEEKVQNVLKLLEEDGDSFAKRAEMYYKRRPELINFVEETYKAYRALAERYDHLSTELQNANNTIASVFPDRVPYMDEDDEDGSPRTPRKLPEGFKQNVPKPPVKDLKTIVTAAAATKKLQSKKPAPKAVQTKAPKSGLSRKEALEEVDKLQKQILALQTVKEFVKSSYDNAIARYWETEEQINEFQEKVSNLQDELGEGIVIEDSEARRLMAEAALTSCQEALTQLEQKQERSLDETKVESKRIKEVKAKLSSLMNEFHYDQSISREPRAKRDLKIASETKDLQEEEDRATQRRKELQSLQDNIKEHFAAGSNSSLSVPEMAEKIDELVNKVVSLETAVSSQTALVTRLRRETDELHNQVRTLEGDKESLIKDKSRLNDQLREMEENLHAVQDLNQVVEDQNSDLQSHFTEARSNIDHLSEKVNYEKQGGEVNATNVSETEKNPSDQGNVSLNDVRSDIEAVKSEKDLKVGTKEDDSTSDKKHGITGLPENSVHTDNELKAMRSLENGDKSGKEVKVGTVEDGLTLTSDKNKKLEINGLLDNGVHADKELKAAGLLENDVRSGNEANSLEMAKATPMENKSPDLNPAYTDEKATVVPILNTTTENQVNQPQATTKADNSTDNLGGQQGTDAKEIPSMTLFAVKGDPTEKATAQEDEPDWQQMFLNGMQDREKVLLTEYTNTLRNYKDVKRRLTEIEKKIQDDNTDSSLELKELKAANALKDEEIRLLHQKLSLLNRSLEGTKDLADETLVLPHNIEELMKIEHPQTTSAIEEKFRAKIDEILEENLTFWMKFSGSFAEIQRFETTIKDLQIEVSKIEAKSKALEGSSSTKYSLKSDARPIYKHLSEIQSEMTIWLEKSTLLKEELQGRFSSLCNIQEEITTELKNSAEDDDFKFTSYQAAKFQGEILNMKQENNKVADELQTGLDAVTSLQGGVEKALVKLNDQFGLSASRRLSHSEAKARVPLRSFIFGVKPKKQSIFSYISPAMHKKRSSKEKEKGHGHGA